MLIFELLAIREGIILTGCSVRVNINEGIEEFSIYNGSIAFDFSKLFLQL